MSERRTTVQWRLRNREGTESWEDYFCARAVSGPMMKKGPLIYCQSEAIIGGTESAAGASGNCTCGAVARTPEVASPLLPLPSPLFGVIRFAKLGAQFPEKCYMFIDGPT